MRRLAAAAAAAGTAAITVGTICSQSLEADDGSLRAATSGQSADTAASLREAGMAVLPSVLDVSTAAEIWVNVSSLAESLGALAAACLPTIHQADSWNRMTQGALMGKLAAATVAAQQSPSLLGCEEAVSQLRVHATRPWPDATGGWRMLSLQPAPAELDALDELVDEMMSRAATELDARFDGSWRDRLLESGLVEEREEQDDVGSPLLGTGPAATRLRAWCGVLLAPALQWSGVVQECSERQQEPMVQHRVSLLVPAREALAFAEPSPAPSPSPSLLAELRHRLPQMALWPQVGPSDGIAVLLPLPGAAAGPPPKTGLSSALATNLAAGDGWVAAAVTATASAFDEAPAAQPPPSPRPSRRYTRIDILPPLGTTALGTPTLRPALRLRLPAGDALVLSGRTRWRLVDDPDDATTTLLFEYRPRPATAATEGPAASEVATARLVDGASVLLRGAFAMVAAGGAAPPDVHTGGAASAPPCTPCH